MPFYAKKRGVDLTFFAKHYESRGWSLIPLLGDLDSSRTKLPAIKWGRYQHTRATAVEIEDWFVRKGYGGIGIVCGHISHLAVLDFDDSDKVSEFRHLLPHLAETYIVESGIRRQPHFYYHIPDGLAVHSRSALGVDFRADGAYVVAPPTCAGDAQWQVVRDENPLTLSEADLRAIWRFLAAIPSPMPENGLKPHSRSIPGQLDSQSGRSSSDVSLAAARCRNSDTFAIDLVALYQERLSNGRNNALFQVACLARDEGWTQADVCHTLASVHGLQADSKGQRQSFQERYAEALRTISSAYSRQPRRKPAAPTDSIDNETPSVGIPTLAAPGVSNGLPNIVREWLLQHGMVAAARVLDGLYMAGLQAGTIITERQICEQLRPCGIGRRAVIVALKGRLSDGAPIFKRGRNPLHTTPEAADAAKGSKGGEKKCGLSQVAKRVKNRGRPAACYRLPDCAELAARLGLQLSGGDQLTGNDLASPTTYRRALHRELVKRRPGQYARHWLAERLGVSPWSSRRYDAALHTAVHPMYVEQVIRWANVESLLPLALENAIPGTFLEDGEGKRYPPLRSVAMRLLDAGCAVIFKQRAANHYAFEPDVSVGIPTLAVTVPEGYKPVGSHQPRILVTNAVPHVIAPQDSYSHSPNPKPEKLQSLTINHATPSPTYQQSVGIPTPAASASSTPAAHNHNFWCCPNCLKTRLAATAPDACDRCGENKWDCVPDFIWRHQERLKIWWQTRWREKHPSAPRRATPLVDNRKCRNSDTYNLHTHKPLDPQAEAAARNAHRQIAGLSLNNARRLVSRYGITAIEKGVKTLKERIGIINPAGFLVTLLRSEHSFYKKAGNKASRAVENSSDWVSRMAASPFVDFLANADEFKLSRGK